MSTEAFQHESAGGESPGAMENILSRTSAPNRMSAGDKRLQTIGFHIL